MMWRVFLLLLLSFGAGAQESFRFVILGDRTGEAQPGVYERVWKEVAAERPAIVVGVGDTIEELHDEAAEEQWQEWARTMRPYREIPLYLAPGNHYIWSSLSERLYRRYSGRALHYSFNHG